MHYLSPYHLSSISLLPCLLLTLVSGMNPITLDVKLNSLTQKNIVLYMWTFQEAILAQHVLFYIFNIKFIAFLKTFLLFSSSKKPIRNIQFPRNDTKVPTDSYAENVACKVPLHFGTLM